MYFYQPIYEEFKVEQVFSGNKYKNQSNHIFIIFLKLIKLYISEFNKHIYINPKYYSNLKKISVESLKENQFDFFVKYFSKFQIENLQLKYINFNYKNNLLQFNQLKNLDITITEKKWKCNFWIIEN